MQLIGQGRVAEVFARGDAVLKLYVAGQPKTSAFREAATLALVEAAGLPAPRVSGVGEMDGRWGVAMSRVEGPSFGEAMQTSPDSMAGYLAAMASAQAAIHAAPGTGLPSLAGRLARNIWRAPGLDEALRQRLIARLRALPEGDRLLHGDFHPHNVMGEPGSATVVDWLDASCGPPAADLCRSWVLLSAGAPELAEPYLDAYLARTGVERGAAMAWLPVIAAARLAEGELKEAPMLRAWAAEV